MVEIIPITYQSERYFEQLDVRYDQLRKPLGRDYTPEYLAAEKDYYFLAAMHDGKVVGSIALAKQDATQVRFRQIAVAADQQGKGIGKAMLKEAERVAISQGYKTGIIHSRIEAVGFYEKAGYVVAGEPYSEVGVPHITLEKKLA